MASTTYYTRLGPAQIKYPIKISTTLPNLSVTQTVTFKASAVNPLDYSLNDVNSALDTTAQYYVMLAPLGEDRTNGGLTYSAASPMSGPITVSAGNPAILVNIVASSFPSGLNKSFAMGVFLSKNSTDNFGLVQYGIIDRTGNDYNDLIICEPLPSQTFYSAASLQTATSSSTFEELGSRLAYGCDFSPTIRTTGGVQIARQVDVVPINPDNSTQYPQRLGAGTTISFRSLANNMKDVVKYNAGKYGKFAVTGGHIVEVSKMSMQSALSLMTGNLPIQLILPADVNRKLEVKFYLASVTINPNGASESWTKTADAALPVTISTTNVDPLLNNIDVELGNIFRSAT